MTKFLLGLLCFIAFFEAHGQAQAPDVLARAKAAYASAAFEDALSLLSSLHDKASPESSGVTAELGTWIPTETDEGGDGLTR